MIIILKIMSEFKQYRRRHISEARPYIKGEVLESKVSISEADHKRVVQKLVI